MEHLHAIKRIAREMMANDRGSHGWDHAERVWNLCRRIGVIEGADMEVLEIAAYLHDIGRDVEKESEGTVCHAEIGAARAREILEALGLSDDIVRRVVDCIAAHRFRGGGPAPETIEACVLFDADKLDSIGAVGVGRAFLFAGEVGARLHNSDTDIAATEAYSREDTAFREFSVKLSGIKERMLTCSGRRIAEERHAFMVSFFDRLREEVAGSK